MINYNGKIVSKNEINLTNENRAFKFGDGIFETLKIKNDKIIFWEDHYFRLMSSMRMLRMKIPMNFTLEFLNNEILKTLTIDSKGKEFRCRLNIFRKDGGLYAPNTNEVDFLIEIKHLNNLNFSTYKIDLYKDFYNYSGLLSTIKTTNRMINILASIFSIENDLNNCILLNERKGIVEAVNGNIFLIHGNIVKTPALTEGCIKGIIRKKIIEKLQKSEHYKIEQISISPFEIQKSDEVFITNSIIGIQPVTHYRKKEFKTTITQKFQKILNVLELTS